MSKFDLNKKYTYADSLSWPENERWEIHDGLPYMQASPSWQHQEISVQLSTQFNNYLSGNSCRVFSAPFDVRLPDAGQTDEETTFVVQPDITVICDSKKLKGTGYYGVPDLIIEITSPSTSKVDKITKFNRYEQVGVPEYWIIEPEGRVVTVFTLQENRRYGRPEVYPEDGNIIVDTFPDFTVDLKLVFRNIL